MKPLSINRKSWLFKLACLGTSRLEWNDETNTCEYLAAIIKGLIKGITVSVILLVVAFMFIITPLFGVYAGFKCGFFLPEEALKACMGPAGNWAVSGMIMISVWIVLGVLFILFCTWQFSADKVKKILNSQANPNIAKELYTSWKDKTCTKIEIKD